MSPHKQIHGVKLLLDENQGDKYGPSLRAKKLLGAIQKNPVDVAGDYVEKMICHVQQNLKRRFGPAIKEMNKSFIITVPAVWSDKAQDSTLKVAIKAGIPQDQLRLLSEPEAAALYTLHAIQPNTINVRTYLDNVD